MMTFSCSFPEKKTMPLIHHVEITTWLAPKLTLKETAFFASPEASCGDCHVVKTFMD
jgi:hypothetical protein